MEESRVIYIWCDIGKPCAVTLRHNMYAYYVHVLNGKDENTNAPYRMHIYFKCQQRKAILIWWIRHEYKKVVANFLQHIRSL